MKLDATDSFVTVIDVQPTFLAGIWQRDQIVERTKFLIQCANLLGVPVLATEQYPERMGGTEPGVQELLGEPPYSKMAFSCCGSEAYLEKAESLSRTQAVLVGIETHICVTQTALDLLENGYEVFLAVDAVSCRMEDAHKIGIKRLRDAGVEVCHTESVVYEWMQGADHEKFRDVLKIVKGS